MPNMKYIGYEENASHSAAFSQKGLPWYAFLDVEERDASYATAKFVLLRRMPDESYKVLNKGIVRRNSGRGAPDAAYKEAVDLVEEAVRIHIDAEVAGLTYVGVGPHISLEDVCGTDVQAPIEQAYDVASDLLRHLN